MSNFIFSFAVRMIGVLLFIMISGLFINVNYKLLILYFFYESFTHSRSIVHSMCKRFVKIPNSE